MNSQSSDLKSDQYKMIVNSKSKIPPLQTPLKNRLQTLFVLLHSTSMCVFCCLYFLGWCVPYFWPLMLHYTIWYYLLDRSPVNGGVFERRSEWFRNLKLWKILVGYFPIKLHKMQDLKPTFETTVGDGGKLIEKRIGPTYIFGYHPHGIIATGVACGFTNNGAGFAQIFPGIKCFVTTLVNQFRIPFYRDYLMAMGVTTVVKQNLKLLINKGASVVIVVGGARESLLAKPGLNSLVLNKRKGFIKLALESIEEKGICVVPVYGFGENDIYDVFSTVETFSREKNNHHIEGEFENQDSNHNSNIVIRNFIRNTLHRFQLFLKDNFGFTLPIVISRGVFNYDFGILPYRKPINVVFGKPLNIERLDGLKYGDEVTQREIDYWHGKYVEELKKVWEWGSPQFSYPGDQELNILE